MSTLEHHPVAAVRGRILVLVGCLALSVFCFSPRLWLMTREVPGSFQWERARTYLKQCEQPLRRDVETAMRWRLLPPAVAHVFGLTGRQPLLLPWLGVVALLGYVVTLHAQRLPDARFVWGGTLLVATSSAVIVPVGWLGINDAWCWLALAVVAFSRRPAAVATACLLGPWLDERFLIGLPLACVVAAVDHAADIRSRSFWLPLAAVLPYVATRLICGGNPATDAPARDFLATQWANVGTFLPMIPIGGWMAWRLGWMSSAYALIATTGAARGALAFTLVATLAVSFFLASDLSRSAAIALPVMLLGTFQLAQQSPRRAPAALLVAGMLNLIVPAAHVVWVHVDSIDPLPVELYRVMRGS